MSYTLLRVIEAGVVLFEQHRRRFEQSGARAVSAFESFAAAASPGIYALQWTNDRLAVVMRVRSRLRDGMPVRFMRTPLGTADLHQRKTPPPHSYDGVRAEGVVSLLTSPDGREVYEACSAAVVSWRDGQFILAPSDRPRVWSTTEAWLGEATSCTEAPILVEDDAPLALINAVAGICLVSVPRRKSMPELPREIIRSLLPITARRR